MFDVRLLDKIKFSADFSPEEKAEIATLDDTIFKKFDPLEPIINEGDEGKSFFIILTGSVSVYKRPNVNPIAELVPGAVFGEVSFLSPKLRTASIVANEETIVLEFSRDILNNLSFGLRDKLKDKLIFLLVKHLDDVINLRTREFYDIDKVSRFTKGNRKVRSIPQKVMIFSDKGYNIYYLGNMEALLENEIDGTEKTVKMVNLQEEIPRKFAYYIKESKQNPEDYLYADSGKFGGYLVPKAARHAWKSTMISFRSEQMLLERESKLFQKLDNIF